MSGAGAGAVSRQSGESFKARLWGLLIVATCAAALLVGARLSPDPAGHGTHTALGLPPCAFLQVFGRPCMTCGMTTAVSLAAHGRIVESFGVQPAGALVAVVLASGLWLGLHALVAGVSPWPTIDSLARPRAMVFAVALLIAAWVYKIVTF